MPTTFEDFFVVGNTTTSSGFSHYVYEDTGTGSRWHLGLFENDNTVAARDVLNGADVRILMVGGGGSGGGGANSGADTSCGFGGGGGGHLLVRAVAGSPALELTKVYDLTVGKQGDGVIGRGSHNGGSTTFGYRQYGAFKCPEAGGGRGGNSTLSDPGQQGGVVSSGESAGFTRLYEGTGGNGGSSGTSATFYNGVAGTNASNVDPLYGNSAIPGHYWIGPSQGAGFGSVAVGGGGGGGGGRNYPGSTPNEYVGSGGIPGYDGYGGDFGRSTHSGHIITSSNGHHAVYSVNVGPGSVSKVGGGGGGAGTPEFGSQSTSGSGANGVLMIWFEEPAVANPPVVHDNAYYTLNYSPYALVTNTYKRLEYPDNRVVDYYTSVVVGGDTANISFKNTMVGLSAEILLVGGGGGGGGGDDATRTYSGSGGGGGGHLYGYCLVGTTGQPIAPSTTYDIAIGDGGYGGFGSSVGSQGQPTTFGAGQWTTPAAVSGGGGGGAYDNNGTPGADGGITNGGNITQLSGGSGGAGGEGSTQPPANPLVIGSGSAGNAAATGVGGSGKYTLVGFGDITVGGGGGGGAGIRSPSQKYGDAYGQGGSAGQGSGGAGGTVVAPNNFYRAQSATMLVTNTSAVGGGGGGGGGIPLANNTGETGVHGGHGGDGVFMVRVVKEIQPSQPVLTPIANLEPYVSVSPSGPSSEFTAYKFVQENDDTSKITWYLGVMKAGSYSVTPNADASGVDVSMLLVGGGGGGGGTANLTSPSKSLNSGGGGGGGHLLVSATAGSSTFQVGTAHSVSVGQAGGGGSYNLGSHQAIPGGSGNPTTITRSGWASGPVVTGGGGGQTTSATGIPNRGGTNGGISDDGTSVGFKVLNNQNGGNGGSGGNGATAASSYIGFSGGNASNVDGEYGFPGTPGTYYVGPYFGSLFGRVKVGGGGGGGGGEYSQTSTGTVVGTGGKKGYNGYGGVGGSIASGPPAGPENGVTSYTIGSYKLSYVGGGGGGSGTAQPNNTGTGGSGANGTFMMWFKVITPATVSTPYYSLSYVNSNVKTVTKTETLHDGSTKTYYTSVITGGDYNAIEFLPAGSGKDFQLLLAAGGGGGGGGTNQTRTYTGSGGGGGGHMLGSGTVGTTLAVSTLYEIELGNAGQNGGGADVGGGGGDSTFGKNVLTTYPIVTGGHGGTSLNPQTGADSLGGNLTQHLPLTLVCGGAGGNGGDGGVGTVTGVSSVESFTVNPGSNGQDSALGNTGIAGFYMFEGYGAIGVSGGGGGGGGLRTLAWKVKEATGEGGENGFGKGGDGGAAPYSGTEYDGLNAGTIAGESHSEGGGGGGGGGIPPDPESANNKQSQGGGGGGGLFAIYMVVTTPAPPPPTPGPPVGNEYFTFGSSGSDLVFQELPPGNVCECGGTPSRSFMAVTTADNVLTFHPAADGLMVEFAVVGAGGQGGGGINSVVKHAGQGGGGGGIVYGKGTIGTHIAHSVGHNIEIGKNTQTGGYGITAGSDGSNTSFGANVWAPLGVQASGGKGGGVLTPAGQGGTMVSPGPLHSVVYGSGGDGGTQLSDGDGMTGGNAVSGPSWSNGTFGLPGYGNVVCSGGGGGGAGKPDDEQSGSGGMPGTGEGGDGGTLGGHHPDGASAETYTLTNAAMGGGGGGGAGMQTREIGVSDGGDGANGLFLMVLHIPSDCLVNDPICGCGIIAKCPEPVNYVKLNTGGNDPKINPAIAYAMYIRGSRGRPGYQRIQTGNQPLNAFGSYAGAPGGSRAPPRNKFG